MLVFRSLVVGLLGAILMLLVAGAASRPEAAPAHRALAAPATGTTIVDVSRSRAPGVLDLQATLGLRPGERMVAIDGAPASDDVLAAHWFAVSAGGYLDVEIGNGAGNRRIVVLAHD